MLAVMIGLYVLIMTGACIWKYQNFLYDGLDLAIYNNALWNTAHGNWFWSSIQGHNYWGDHFEPILILLLPIYYLWQSPILLLILQTLALGLAAWPLYKVVTQIYPERAQHLRGESKDPVSQCISVDSGVYESTWDPSPRETQCGTQDKVGVLALSIALLWLINPLVHNINLYEFHAIALLPLLFFWLFYIYLKLKKQSSKRLILCFYVLMFLCLTVREDVTFIILPFLILVGADALKNKNKFLLRVTSYELLVTVLYLIISFQLISHFSPSGFSPFAYYYGWLTKASVGQILAHLVTLTNLEMVLGFLAPFFFLPALKPKWLILTVIPLAQIIFSAAGGGALVWQLHYGALFLPGLVLAFVYGFQMANQWTTRYFWDGKLLFLIIIIFNLALWPSFGPGGIKNKITGQEAAKRAMIQKIEPGAGVMTGFRLLPNLSSRGEIYALHYYFLGVQQFAQAEYRVENETRYAIIDEEDYQYYDDILKTSAWAGKYYDRGYERLEKLLSSYEKMEETGTISLWGKI